MGCMDLVDNNSGHWFFCDDLSGRYGCAASANGLAEFVGMLCGEDTVTDEVIRINIEPSKQPLGDMPDVSVLKEEMAAAMQKAWREGNEKKLQFLDQNVQKLHGEAMNVLHIRIENIWCRKTLEDMLSPLLSYSGIGSIYCRTATAGKSMLHLDIEVMEPVRGWNETLADLNAITQAELHWHKKSDSGCVGEIKRGESAPHLDWKQMTIKEVYPEGKFLVFLRYCMDNNLEYMHQLLDFDFSSLANVRQMGPKTIKLIQERYNETIKKKAELEAAVNDGETPFSQIHFTMRDLSVDVLLNVSCKKGLISKFKADNMNKLGDLSMCSWAWIKEKIYQAKREEILPEINRFIQQNVYEAFINCLNNIKKDNEVDYKIILALAAGKSMNEIAKENGYADRRNIDEKRRHKYAPKLEPITRGLVECEMKSSYRNYISVDRLRKIYANEEDGNNYGNVLIYWVRSCFDFIDCAEVFVEKQDGTDPKEIIWHKLENILGENASLSETAAVFSDSYEEYPYMNADAIKELLFEHGYKVYDDSILNGNDKASLCEPIIAQYFPEGIYPAEYGRLIEICRMRYGEQIVAEKIQGNDITLKNALGNKLILCGRGDKYTSPQNVRWQELRPLLEEIVKYIDTQPLQQIKYQELFTRFADRLCAYDVTEYQYLHGLLKYSYPQHYSYGRVWIKRSGEGLIMKSLAERIEEKILANQGFLHKNAIKEKLGVGEFTLNSTVKESKTLFLDGEGNIFSTQLYSYDPADVELLRSCIEEIMRDNKGYCNAVLLFQAMQEHNAIFLHNQERMNPGILYGLVEKILADDAYVFSRPHILHRRIELPEINWAQVLMYLLDNPQRLLLNDVEETIQRIRWPQRLKYIVFKQLWNYYYRISEDMLVRKDVFCLGEETLREIENILDRALDDGPVLLANLNLDTLAPIPMLKDCVWNEYLLRSVIAYNFSDRYRVIDPNITDYRYEKGLVVKANSPFHDLIDIVVDYWRGKDRVVVSDIEMLDMLQNRFGWEKLPAELKQDKKRLLYKSTSNDGSYFQLGVK